MRITYRTTRDKIKTISVEEKENHFYLYQIYYLFPNYYGISIAKVINVTTI